MKIARDMGRSAMSCDRAVLRCYTGEILVTKREKQALDGSVRV